MRHYLYLCFLAATLCGAVSCQQAEELMPTLSKTETNSKYLTDDGLYDVTVDTEKKTATINYLTDKNEDKTTVTIPATVLYQNAVYTVTGLDGVYFDANKSVTSITLPDGLETIGDECFKSMSIEEIKIPESVTSIGKLAFLCCYHLKNVNIPSKISVIPEKAFDLCASLQSIELPEGLTEIGRMAFAYSALRDVKFPSTLKEISISAFRNTCIESLVLPESLTSIWGDAFYGCPKLTKVIIPDKVSGLGGTFEECSNLSEVTIGVGITSIGDDAFSQCPKLNRFNCFATNPPSLSSNAFSESTYQTCVVYVPKESLNAYKNDTNWKQFKHIESMSSDETPDTEEQKAAITDETATIPVGTYEAGNLTYSRSTSNMGKGKYVTICLPFSISLADTDCFSDVMIPLNIALYNTTNSGMLTIMMDKPSKTATIPAGQPFLAKLSGNTVELKNSVRTYIRSTYSEDLAANMVTKFKVFNYDGQSGVLEKNEDLDVRFCGSFEAKTGLDKTCYRTFMSNGSFAKADNIGAFRAYIYKANKESQANLQSLTIATDGVAADILKGNYTINGNQLIIKK